jgi:hypothetical protein
VSPIPYAYRELEKTMNPFRRGPRRSTRAGLCTGVPAGRSDEVRDEQGIDWPDLIIDWPHAPQAV